MKCIYTKPKFNYREKLYILGLIGLMPIICGCQRPIDVSPPSKDSVSTTQAKPQSPGSISFATPVKKYKTRFSSFFLSPDARWMIGQTAPRQEGNKEQAFLSNVDGQIVKNLPMPGQPVVPYGIASPWSPDSKKFLTFSPDTSVFQTNLLVYPITNNKVGKPIRLEAPGMVEVLPKFSPKGNFVVVGVNTNPEFSWVNSLVTWKLDQSPAFGPRLFTFRLSVCNMIWLDNQHVWVITRGHNLSEQNASQDSTDEYYTEIYLLNCVTGYSRPVKKLTKRSISNVLPYADKEGHVIAVTSQGRNHELYLEVFDPKTEKSIYQQPLEPPYPQVLLTFGRMNLWRVIGNTQHIYLYCIRKSSVEIRHYNQKTKKLGKIHHLPITGLPNVDNSGQVWGLKNGAGKKDGVMSNFGKLE